jgi:FKBP-type peptidyl-prolyl cis-trans isomerase (trigger factor)
MKYQRQFKEIMKWFDHEIGQANYTAELYYADKSFKYDDLFEYDEHSHFRFHATEQIQFDLWIEKYNQELIIEINNENINENIRIVILAFNIIDKNSKKQFYDIVKKFWHLI